MTYTKQGSALVLLVGIGLTSCGPDSCGREEWAATRQVCRDAYRASQVAKRDAKQGEPKIIKQPRDALLDVVVRPSSSGSTARIDPQLLPCPWPPGVVKICP